MKFLVFALFIGSAFAYDLEDIIDVIEQHHDVECLVDTKGWDLALRLGMLDSYSGELFTARNINVWVMRKTSK
jgi:hypothetical protein